MDHLNAPGYVEAWNAVEVKCSCDRRSLSGGRPSSNLGRSLAAASPRPLEEGLAQRSRALGDPRPDAAIAARLTDEIVGRLRATDRHPGAPSALRDESRLRCRRRRGNVDGPCWNSLPSLTERSEVGVARAHRRHTILPAGRDLSHSTLGRAGLFLPASVPAGDQRRRRGGVPPPVRDYLSGTFVTRKPFGETRMT